MMFKDLAVGQTFDWVDDTRTGYNSFYAACRKTSARKYTDGRFDYRVGSVRAEVFHVGQVEVAVANDPIAPAQPSLVTRPEPDALVSGGGSIYQLTPLSEAAKAWISENVQAEGFMWMGSSLCVEHRYIADIVQGMQDAGLEVR